MLKMIAVAAVLALAPVAAQAAMDCCKDCACCKDKKGEAKPGDQPAEAQPQQH